MSTHRMNAIAWLRCSSRAMTFRAAATIRNLVCTFSAQCQNIATTTPFCILAKIRASSRRVCLSFFTTAPHILQQHLHRLPVLHLRESAFDLCDHAAHACHLVRMIPTFIFKIRCTTHRTSRRIAARSPVNPSHLLHAADTAPILIRRMALFMRVCTLFRSAAKPSHPCHAADTTPNFIRSIMLPMRVCSLRARSSRWRLNRHHCLHAPSIFCSLIHSRDFLIFAFRVTCARTDAVHTVHTLTSFKF